MENLITYQPAGKKVRLGRKSDGGYVIVDGLEYDCYISCGMSDEVSFDEAFVRQHPDVPAHAYDGTVRRPRALPESVMFFRTNIGPSESPTTTNLVHMSGPYHEIFLKMDIEGAEWKWLLEIPNQMLQSVKQIAIELHGLFDGSYGATVADKTAALERLNETHRLVHVHGNNYGSINNSVPNVLETTWIRKDVGLAGLNERSFPINGLDFANDLTKQDYLLNRWPFVAVNDKK